MRSLCTECGHPIRKPNRTMHVSCAQNAQPSSPTIISDHRRACSFCLSTDTRIINGAPFCREHEPGDSGPRVRSQTTLTIVPERCPNCDEFLTPTVTKGKIKCKCDQPSPPRPCLPGCSKPHVHLTEAAWLARMGKVPQTVRYGN